MRPHEQQPTVQVSWRATPPSPSQLAAWNWLWARLLSHVAPGPETPQPQDRGAPGAATVATVDSGHNLLSESTHDSTPRTLNT